MKKINKTLIDDFTSHYIMLIIYLTYTMLQTYLLKKEFSFARNGELKRRALLRYLETLPSKNDYQKEAYSLIRLHEMLNQHKLNVEQFTALTAPQICIIWTTLYDQIMDQSNHCELANDFSFSSNVLQVFVRGI